VSSDDVMCENLRKNVGRKLHLIYFQRRRKIVVEKVNLQHFVVGTGRHWQCGEIPHKFDDDNMMAAFGSAVNVAYSVW
jgi:hypothetical protein